MAYKPKPFEIAGFELVGWRQADGDLRLGDAKRGTLVKDFPKEVHVCGATYTLEEIKRNRDDGPPLAEDHPGFFMEWGVYV